MVEFITIKDEEILFGDNNFFEIAHKKVVSEECEKQFVSIIRGYFTLGKQKKFTKVITIPNEGTILTDVINALTKITR